MRKPDAVQTPQVARFQLADCGREDEGQLDELERSVSMPLVERVMLDGFGVTGFFGEGERIVSVRTLPCPEDISLVKRMVNTLKGNAALYGMASVAHRWHATEDSILETQGRPAQLLLGELRERLTRPAAYVELLLNSRVDVIEIDEQQYAGLESAASAGETGEAMLQSVPGLRMKATLTRLKYFQEQANRIADRLGKTPLGVELEDRDMGLDRRRWAGFWGAVVDAFRNALDHDVESPEARAAAGQMARARAALRTYEQHSDVIVEVAKNGRDIDWAEVARHAARAGLPTQDSLALERAFFSNGTSTAACVSDISGRRIGMGALLAAIRDSGGDPRVESKAHEATLIRLTFPAAMMSQVRHIEPLNQAS